MENSLNNGNCFFSLKTHTLYSKSDSIEVMMDHETDTIIEDLFDYFLQRYLE